MTSPHSLTHTVVVVPPLLLLLLHSSMRARNCCSVLRHPLVDERDTPQDTVPALTSIVRQQQAAAVVVVVRARMRVPLPGDNAATATLIVPVLVQLVAWVAAKQAKETVVQCIAAVGRLSAQHEQPWQCARQTRTRTSLFSTYELRTHEWKLALQPC